jgi:hypothetical protein
MLTPIIREDLLYYLWKTKSFDMTNLFTKDGQPIEIIEFGNQNYDSGPDFSNGKVKIGDTIWAGNIEMHVYSSDWERHNHDLDKAYDNVILHVVYEHDREVHTTTEQFIPCLELKNRIAAKIKHNYAKLISNNSWIPCESQLPNVAEHTITFWLQRMVAERLESKTDYLKTILVQTNNDWEETMYIYLMRYMGARVNMDPFESLAKNLPLSIVQKNKDDLHKIEALLYGQAGMLLATHADDAYFEGLKSEFQFLSKKYRLTNIPPVSWKFSKMRPAGFPTVRIAQLAQIFYNTENLFSQILGAQDTKSIKHLFHATPSEYWEHHYRFGTESIYREKQLGGGFIDLIIINVVSPILFLYGKSIADEQYCERAIEHLESLKPEKNKIITNYKDRGVKATSAADSQGLLQLKKAYCDPKLCLSCSIGNKLIV